MGAWLAAAVGGIAAGGLELVEAGVLPGRYRLAQLLGECGSALARPAWPLPELRQQLFWSRYRHRAVRLVTLVPARVPAGSRLGTVIALHGLGGDALGAARLYRPAMAAAGIRRVAVICADGGGTYWHRRRDGDDPPAMIIREVLPRAAARGGV